MPHSAVSKRMLKQPHPHCTGLSAQWMGENFLLAATAEGGLILCTDVRDKENSECHWYSLGSWQVTRELCRF